MSRRSDCNLLPFVVPVGRRTLLRASSRLDEKRDWSCEVVVFMITFVEGGLHRLAQLGSGGGYSGGALCW